MTQYNVEQDLLEHNIGGL